MVFADQYLRRGQNVAGFLYDRSYANWNGLLSFAIGLVVSVVLFSNQEKFVGCIAKAYPQLGDITFFVGFLLAGAAIWCCADRRSPRSGPPYDGRRSRCSTSPVDEARKGLAEGGIPIGAALFSVRRHAARAAGTTGGCSTTTRRCTPRPTRSATPAGSATTAPR